MHLHLHLIQEEFTSIKLELERKRFCCICRVRFYEYTPACLSLIPLLHISSVKCDFLCLNIDNLRLELYCKSVEEGIC